MDLGALRTAAVLAPNWVGDVVMATPALRALRRALPRASITLVVRAYVRRVLDGAPWFDRVVELEGRARSLASVVSAARALRAARPDLAVVFPNSFRSALTVALGGATHRVGYRRDGRSLLLTRAVDRPGAGGTFQPVYMVDYYLNLLAEAGIPAGPRTLALYVTDDEARRCAALLDGLGVGEGDRLVGLNPGAAWGSSKCWPAERFAAAGDRIADATGARIVVLAGPGEEAVQQAIVSAMKTGALAPPPAAVPLDLLKPLVRRLALLVTNDTGPRHFANALQTPAVVVMGPTDARYTSDPTERATVLQSDRDCVPCHLKTCPRGHECMLDITAEQVADAALAYL